jgi:alanyl-tRNA synthetase
MRLYYHDSYLREFDARVVDRRGDTTIYLDRSAFYPASGGQPSDRGTLAGVAVVDVVEEEDGRIAHVLESPFEGDVVAGQIDWQRRFDHMQQHTGQHLLSSVFMDLFGMQTISFHMGSEVSTIDLAVPAISQEQLEAAEARACALVFENRPVTVTFQDAEGVQGLLRKASDRTGELRLVHIAEVDHSACGGTHVRATGEIGPIQIRKVDKIRGNVRLEFVCGSRTVARARRDYNALSAIARSFSAAVDETPALVSAQLEKAQEADKARRKVANELAALQGKALYDATPAGPDGVRRHLYRGPLSDEIRTQAQVFTAQPKAVFLALCEQPPSLLLAASKDSGVQAGATVKQSVARGGGSPQMAQGSAASLEELQLAEQRITADWPKNSI